MRVAADFNVSVAQSLDLARRMLPKAEHAQLDHIGSASGRLRGRARTERAAHAGWKATVEVTQSDAAFQVKELPWPVVLQSARASASARQIAVSALRASLGQSSLENASALVTLGEQPSVKSATAQATLALGELFPWLQAQPSLADALRDISAATGAAHVTLTRLAGPLNRPRALQYELTVQPKQVTVAHRQLPDRLNVASGAIRVDPVNLTFDGMAVAMSDAHAALSGRIDDYRGERLRAAVSVADGAVGPKAMQWAWERADAPPRLLPVTPFRFTIAHARWDGERNLDVNGAAQSGSGQDLTFDFAWNPRALDVRRIAIKDALSDASVAFATRRRLLQAHFSGNLDGRSVAAMLKEGYEHAGVIDGDLRIAFDRDAPERTTAQGRLTASTIDLSRVLAWPVRVDRIALEAEDKVLRIREAVVNWQQQTATMSGEVQRSENGLNVNGRIELPGIDLDTLLPTKSAGSDKSDEASAKQTSTPAHEEGILPQLWPLPFTGRIDVRTPSLQYEEHRVAPVVASVTLEAQRAQIVLQEAQVCGIAFPMTAALTRQNLALSVQLLARGQELADVVRCLTNQEILMTGRFELHADLRTHGDGSDLVRNLSGTLEAQALDGSTYKFNLLGNILSFKPVAELIEGDRPQLEKDGVPYRRLKVAGRFDSGKFHVDEGIFDSDAIGLAATGPIDLVTRDAALTALVAPFNRVNRMVRHVPIAGYILGGELVSIAVGVHGDIRDPIVAPLGAKAVTKQLTGILERTLELPVKLLTPKDVSEREKQPAAQP